MFGRLFRRQPKNLPPLDQTVYKRGNRWFAYNPIYWEDKGWSTRTANEIYKLAVLIASEKNLDTIQPRPATAPPAPLPQDEDEQDFTNFLVSEEVATIAKQTLDESRYDREPEGD